MDLSGKTALVTGGGSGIGEAIVRTFAGHGARVLIADWNESDWRRVAESLQKDGCAVTGATCDVSAEEDVRRAIDGAVRQYGSLDILVNNAAVILPKYIEDIDSEQWDRLFRINVKSIFYTVKHGIAELRKARGAIVNLASLNGLIGQRMNPAYAATKGAIIALTKALALDYARDGVRVNCLCPAGVATPLLEQWIREQEDPEGAVQALNEMHALGRPASAEEIARAALFLASGSSGFITGVALPVDGGASLGY